MTIRYSTTLDPAAWPCSTHWRAFQVLSWPRIQWLAARCPRCRLIERIPR